MKTPKIEEFLKAGVHFGHRSSKRHPQMTPYIYGVKDNTHIINLEKTEQMLASTVKVVEEMAAAGKTVLFVGTKPQAAKIVAEHATRAGMPYVNNRWLGGLLTNFSVVIEVPRKLTKLKSDREAGNLKKYTKKEQLDFDKEIEKLSLMVGGLENMMKMPDAIFVVDVNHEKTAVREANQKKIPLLAMCDTNVNPLTIEWPVPANDDATKSIELITAAIADAIIAGQKQVEKNNTK